MNVTSLELCKELYELSGWDDTYLRWTNFKPATVVNADEWANHEERLHHLELVGDDVLEEASAAPYPAYDLGYLLRKLPKFIATQNVECRVNVAVTGSKGLTNNPLWYAGYEAVETLEDEAITYGDPIELETATTPEDAAAKLAIELFKQGVLVKPEKGE